MLVFFPQAKAHEFVKLMSENGHLKSATMDLQVLFKSVVSHLLTDPPATLMQYTSVPSGEDIDNLYVAYVGQTVIIIDFYLPWKLLNHEIKNIKFEEPVREESAEQVVQGSYVHL
ncbi:uncharacterized protein At3g06530-like isoform X1 [Solanum lycopersicum]|uniref:uncharacterized protein At3g06530-like isoform X1 n=2 Tax=Solanum lycopersicum TaxID=4081 RepID=UPI000532EB9D|nr:uncharacterized protein LOC101266350 isoform X1 [Solanum lycopersicum]